MDGEELGLLDGTGTEEAALDDAGLESGDGLGGTSEDTSGGGEGTDHAGETRQDDAAGSTDRGSSRASLDVAQVRTALRTLLSADAELGKKFPGLEKAVTGALHLRRQVEGMGGIAQLRSTLDAIEVHGGVEGVTELAEEVEAWRGVEEGLKIGDKQIIDGWAKDYPEGFKRSIGAALDKLEQVDGERYDAEICRGMQKAFTTTGLDGQMQALENAIASGKIEDVKAAFQAWKNFRGQVRNLAGRAGTQPLSDRERDLNARESEQGAKEDKIFKAGVRTQVNTSMTAEMNRQLRAAIKVPKVHTEMANRIRAEIVARLQETVNTQPNYARNYKAVMASRNHDRAIQFVMSAAKAKMPGVIKNVLAYPEYRHLTKAAAGNGAGSGGGEGAQRRRPAQSEGGNRAGGSGSNTVSGRPKTGDVDFSKTDKAVWIATMNSHGQAWGKDGKLYKW